MQTNILHQGITILSMKIKSIFDSIYVTKDFVTTKASIEKDKRI